MRAPVRTLTIAATVIAACALAGCQNEPTAAPDASPATTTATTTATSATPAASPAPSTPHTRRPRRAAAGTTCGHVHVPKGKTYPLVVTRGRVACATAMRTVKRYYAGVSAGRGGGNTATLEVGAYVCQSPTAATAQAQKTVTVCATVHAPHVEFRVKDR